MSLLPDRRRFLRSSLAASGMAALSGALAQDLYVLSLALNLEYLEAQYYSLAYYGQTIEERGVDTSGAGAPGIVNVKASPRVPFTPGGAIEQYAAEIADDEINHVVYLRQTIRNAGTTPPAMPTVDLFNSFHKLGQSAGLGTGFDPFASEENFLLGAFIFEDVGVTAYLGGAKLLGNPAHIKAAAGILAVEGMHAGSIRAIIFGLGQEMRDAAQAISNVRDTFDGEKDKDQGLLDDALRANIVPTDAKGLCYSRSARKVLNILYGGFNVQSGGFFPAGANLLVPSSG